MHMHVFICIWRLFVSLLSNKSDLNIPVGHGLLLAPLTWLQHGLLSAATAILSNHGERRIHSRGGLTRYSFLWRPGHSECSVTADLYLLLPLDMITGHNGSFPTACLPESAKSRLWPWLSLFFLFFFRMKTDIMKISLVSHCAPTRLQTDSDQNLLRLLKKAKRTLMSKYCINPYKSL